MSSASCAGRARLERRTGVTSRGLSGATADHDDSCAERVHRADLNGWRRTYAYGHGGFHAHSGTAHSESDGRAHADACTDATSNTHGNADTHVRAGNADADPAHIADRCADDSATDADRIADADHQRRESDPHAGQARHLSDARASRPDMLQWDAGLTERRASSGRVRHPQPRSRLLRVHG